MSELRPLGSSRRNQWHVSKNVADLVRVQQPARPLMICATPQDVRLDIARTALVIVDMQNGFCHPKGWLASVGVDVSSVRAPINPLMRLTALCRTHDIPIIWVNWGNRPDLLNLGPSTLHVYDPHGLGGGLGDPRVNGSPVLELGSWSAAVVDEFADVSEDIHVAKYAMSGFWETPLDAILRNLRISTLLFGGVNLDQCVLCTLQDASFRGYDCILLEDCTATSSPSYCMEAALYNINQCFGFVANGKAFSEALEAKS